MEKLISREKPVEKQISREKPVDEQISREKPVDEQISRGKIRGLTNFEGKKPWINKSRGEKTCA